MGIKKLNSRNKERITILNLFHKEQSFEKFLQKREEELLTYELHLVHQSHAWPSLLVLLVGILRSKYERQTPRKMNNNFLLQCNDILPSDIQHVNYIL